METKIRSYKRICLYLLHDVIKKYIEDPVSFNEGLRQAIIEELNVDETTVDNVLPFYKNIIKDLVKYYDVEDLETDLSYEKYLNEAYCDNMSEHKHALMDLQSEDILPKITESITLSSSDKDIINIICSLCGNIVKCKVCMNMKSLV